MLGNLVQLERILAERLVELLGERLAVLHYELLHWEHVDIYVGVSGIVYSVPSDGQAWRVVCGALHLVGVPVCLQVRQVAYTCIGALSLHLLVIP